MDQDDDEINEEFGILKTFIGYFLFFLLAFNLYNYIRHVELRYRFAKAMTYDPNSFDLEEIKMRHQKYQTVLDVEVIDNVRVQDLKLLVERLKILKIGFEKYRLFMYIPEIKIFTEDTLEDLDKLYNKANYPKGNTTMSVIVYNETVAFIF